MISVFLNLVLYAQFLYPGWECHCASFAAFYWYSFGFYISWNSIKQINRKCNAIFFLVWKILVLAHSVGSDTRLQAPISRREFTAADATHCPHCSRSLKPAGKSQKARWGCGQSTCEKHWTVHLLSSLNQQSSCEEPRQSLNLHPPGRTLEREQWWHWYGRPCKCRMFDSLGWIMS